MKQISMVFASAGVPAVLTRPDSDEGSPAHGLHAGTDLVDNIPIIGWLDIHSTARRHFSRKFIQFVGYFYLCFYMLNLKNIKLSRLPFLVYIYY